MTEKKKTLKLKSTLKPKDLPAKEDLENNLPDMPYWSMKHYTFLQVYRECLDEKEAAKAAGFDAKELQRALQDPKIKIALEDAKDDFVQALRLTPKKGAKKFLEVYDKIEKRFDSGVSKVAGPLANMAATFLKATGQLGGNDEKVTPKISININLGGDKKQPKIVGNENKIDVSLDDSIYE